MGRRLKRGKLGNAAQYITRTQAIRKLQLRLSEFRRLCILKGVHPREPKKKVHGANKTYYHTKDITWLQHEPLLNAFRNLKAYDKKVRKAHAKLNHQLAQRLAENKPTYKLDHLVKERYPSFLDALRDLDDPLTMVHLFASLPAEKRFRIPIEAVATARRLALEFQAYVVRSHALRKVFVSVKGFYYQADIVGQSVTWLVPHQLAQVLPVDVDYRVMLTFLDFYECLLQFVNFKLYHTLGLKYPPILDASLEEAAAGLAAIMKDLAGLRDDTDALATKAHVAANTSKGQRRRKAAAAATAAAAAGGGAAVAAPLAAALGVPQTAAQPPQKTAAAAVGRASAAKAAAEDDSSDEGGALEIDSGDEDSEDSEVEGEDAVEKEEEEEEGSGDDDEEGDEDSDASEQSAEARRAAGGSASSSAVAQSAAAMEEDGGRGPDDIDDAEDDEGEAAAGGALDLGLAGDDEAAVCGALFRGRTFFLAREVPREPLLFVIRAFGGTAAWEGDGSPLAESDESITHQVVDRPRQGHRFLSRSYVQPQWVIDSANFRCLMPADLYAPGRAPPPHLSPFVNNEEEGYTPEFALRVKKLQEAARAARQRSAGRMHSGTFVGEDAGNGTGDSTAGSMALQRMQEAAAVEAEAAAERAYAAELAKELRAAAKQAEQDADMAAAGHEESGSDAEEHGEPAAVPTQGRKRIEAAKAAAVAEEGAMKDIMMTRKNRKLYERIQRAKEGKSERVGILEKKRAALAQQSEKPQKQARQ